MDPGLLDASQVNVDWLLAILSTLDGNHPFFEKSFVPVKTQPKRVQYVDNQDGFFDDLPQSKQRKRICKQTVMTGKMIEDINHQMDDMHIDEEAPRVSLKSKDGKKIPVKLIDKKGPMMNAQG